MHIVTEFEHDGVVVGVINGNVSILDVIGHEPVIEISSSPPIEVIVIDLQTFPNVTEDDGRAAALDGGVEPLWRRRGGREWTVRKAGRPCLRGA